MASHQRAAEIPDVPSPGPDIHVHSVGLRIAVGLSLGPRLGRPLVSLVRVMVLATEKVREGLAFLLLRREKKSP